MITSPATTTTYTTFESPIGMLLATAEDGSITRLSMQGGRRPTRIDATWERADGEFDSLRAQLGEYFRGERREFDLPLDPRSDSEFELRVWAALREIPFGETESYGALSERIGHPGRARAVGAANGRNPIAVVIPCHRVIGADGNLVGYGGGLERKRLLLDLESPAARLDLSA